QVAGLNHKTAPVELRERLAIGSDVLAETTRALLSRPGVQEAMILSTCNRVEVAVACESRPDLTAALAKSRGLEAAFIEPYVYRHEGTEALRHLFRVASSLDSMVVGEPQILGQLKNAYQVAKDHGSLHGTLESVLTRAFNIAKRVRSETEIGQSAVSISYAAVELSREIFGSLNGKTVLIAGAGKMSELAARHLRRSGATNILVTNRTQSRAEEMARLFEGKVIDYANFHATLPEIDILIASSGAQQYILGPDEVHRAIAVRKNRPMFLIDIAVPRNIDPKTGELDNVFLYDIDDLQKVVERNVSLRQKEAEEAERIVEEEVERTIVILRTRIVAPTIAGLQEQLEVIRAGEMERMRGKFGTLTPQQQEALEALTRGIVNKIAHAHIVEIRKEATKGGGPIVSAVRRVFRLGENP
ncbi:MAG TPA: glutamyl-tRNA reductase, partial [Bryobacteraceae bacterium]